MRLFSFLLLLASQVTMQSQCLQKLTYQPDSLIGKDADLFSALEWENSNFGNSAWLRAESWTRFGAPNLVHGLLSFPIFELIKDLESWNSVVLTLYKDHDYRDSEGGAVGDNASKIYLVTEEWDEKTVTWNNHPTYDENRFLEIPTNNQYDSLTFDLTELIRDLEQNKISFYGFVFINDTEVQYRSLNFSSSDSEVIARRPKIVISYEIDCEEEPEEEEEEIDDQSCLLDIFIPNAFSPNGDGRNDFFFPSLAEGKSTTARVQIFDRWGALIYQGANALGWDGMIAGQKAPIGTYIYLITVRTELRTGTLMLIR